MMNQQNITSLFNSFKKMKLLVIGDVMVDSYIWGKVERISPEAPVPVVAVEKRNSRLGGAANVALNLKAMGANAFLCAVTGNDIRGKEFLELMSTENLSVQGIVLSPERKTTTKFRIIGNNTQMLRVDEETLDPLTQNERKELFAKIEYIFEHEKPDAVIFEDYDKGVIDQWLIDQVIQLSKSKNVPVTVDPKRRNFNAYHHAAIFKPNFKEFCEGVKIDLKRSETEKIFEIVKNIINEREHQFVMITLSDEGSIICHKNGFEHLPAFKRNIADVSGAGDTVISIATLCLAAGLSPQSIAWLSNLAGGLVCEEVGVVPINPQKLLEEALKHSAE